MLSKCHRVSASTHKLLSDKELQKNKTVIRGSFFVLFFYKNVTNDPLRVAVVVSRKVAKSAVRRNTIKRKMIEVLRSTLGAFNGSKKLTNGVLVVSMLPASFDVSYSELCVSFKREYTSLVDTV